MNYHKLTEVIFLHDKLFLSEVFFPHKSYRISMSVILPQNFGNISMNNYHWQLKLIVHAISRKSNFTGGTSVMCIIITLV